MRFGEIAISREHANVAAALVDAELEFNRFPWTQLQLFAGHQVRHQGLLGALIKAKEVSVLEGYRVLEFDQAYHDR
ncbi:hypothetical protein D3C77_746820 [compost metagenome]